MQETDMDLSSIRSIEGKKKRALFKIPIELSIDYDRALTIKRGDLAIIQGEVHLPSLLF